jgi:hypothetical protein
MKRDKMKTRLGLGLAQGVRAPVMDTPVIASWIKVYTYDSDTYACICELNGTDFALIDNSSGFLRTLRWNGTSVVPVGNALEPAVDIGFPFPGAQNTFANADCIIKLNENAIAWIDHQRDDMYRFTWDGTDWTWDNTLFDYGDTAGYANGTYIADNDFVMWSGSTSAQVQRMSHNGTTFTKTGNPLTASGLYNVPVAMGNNRIAVIDTSQDEMRAYDFDGTDWTQVGNAYDIGATTNGKRGGTMLAENKILGWDDYSMQVFTFDGTNFATEGSAFPIGSAWPCSIAKLSDSVVAVHDYGSGGNVYIMEATFA